MRCFVSFRLTFLLQGRVPDSETALSPCSMVRQADWHPAPPGRLTQLNVAIKPRAAFARTQQTTASRESNSLRVRLPSIPLTALQDMILGNKPFPGAACRRLLGSASLERNSFSNKRHSISLSTS